MNTQEMKDMGLVSVPLNVEEVRTVLLALHEAEENYLRRAVRYRDAGFVSNYADAVERAGNAQKLVKWIASHASAEL